MANLNISPELYDIVKEMAYRKYGLKKGNTKRYVERAIKNQIEYDKGNKEGMV
jgi:hypothetical protein